jgi:hypothetical protein
VGGGEESDADAKSQKFKRSDATPYKSGNQAESADELAPEVEVRDGDELY